jgi:hypothetical protein
VLYPRCLLFSRSPFFPSVEISSSMLTVIWSVFSAKGSWTGRTITMQQSLRDGVDSRRLIGLSVAGPNWSGAGQAEMGSWTPGTSF